MQNKISSFYYLKEKEDIKPVITSNGVSSSNKPIPTLDLSYLNGTNDQSKKMTPNTSNPKLIE
jgi:hypothetical protein